MASADPAEQAPRTPWGAWHRRFLVWIAQRLAEPAGTCPNCGWRDVRAGTSPGRPPNCPRCGHAFV